MAKIIHAVAGILKRDDKVLIASRPDGKSYYGCWEFPGGKIEHGESIADALVRELKEEIGVLVKTQSVKRFLYIKQPYPNAGYFSPPHSLLSDFAPDLMGNGKVVDRSSQILSEQTIVHLDIMWVENWENEPVASEGQELFWQPINSFCAKSPLLLTTQKILDILKE